MHTDPVEALVRGICEVAERDAAATIWLQQLAIPPLPARGTDWMSREVEYLLDWCGRHFIDARLFDATTDIGVPTAYCYLAAHSDSEVRQVLGCSSSRTMPRAAEKVLLETLLSRSLLCGTGELPASFKDYAALEHSARYMAYPERSGAFDFLVKDSGERPGRPLVRLPDDPAEALRHLISVLTAKGMQVVAVDRTTSELATARPDLRERAHPGPATDGAVPPGAVPCPPPPDDGACRHGIPGAAGRGDESMASAVRVTRTARSAAVMPTGQFGARVAAIVAAQYQDCAVSRTARSTKRLARRPGSSSPRCGGRARRSASAPTSCPSRPCGPGCR